jgi:glycosyltransferase involved in cell wall biosynthesis
VFREVGPEVYLAEPLPHPPISMQEIKKRRIVIASVLKPVDDTRMTEKIAQTLASRFEVHVVGFPSASSIPPQEVHPHPVSKAHFNRFSVRRLWAPFKFFLVTITIRPQFLIVTTHELLLPAIMLKCLLGLRLFYDVQENYFLNIRSTTAFPRMLRMLVAKYVRIKEWIASPFINHFILAERSYEHELPFLRKRYTIIENKVRACDTVPARERDGYSGRLIFTGTLAASTGVFHAIELASVLHERDAHVMLTIVGYASMASDYERIRAAVAEKKFIKLIGGNRLVPHTEITRHIAEADFGIIAYPPNPSTENSRPTKLFEYLSFQLPILLIDNPSWVAVCKPYPAAVVFNPDHLEPERILHEMTTTRFYKVAADDISWESQEPCLLQLFSA